MPPVLLRIVVFATASVTPLLALNPAKTLTQYAHRIWGHEEGLFQPTVFSIVQTRDGLLWLGTQDSLIRFDGMHFRSFERDSKPLFEHTLIRALSTDAQGNLWIASLGSGSAKLAPDGTLTRYTTHNGLPSDSVFCVVPETQGRTWMCTAQGLVLVDGARMKTFTTADGLPSNRIRSICEAADGTRWVAGLDFGLAQSNGQRFEPYVDPHIGRREIVTALACGRDGSTWAGTESGLVQIHGKTLRRLTTRDGLPDNAVSALAESPNGAIWIGTDDGISRYQNGDISVYRTRDGLSHSLVLSLYFDREGTLWAGTKDGLDQFTDGDVTPYTMNEGLLSNAAGPVIEDREGHLWIGTLDRGLNWFDGRCFHSLTLHDGLLDNRILSLETDAAGDLWVGTRRGLNRLRGGHIAAAYTQRDGLSGSEVRTLTVDASGTLWAGTDRGLDRFDGARFHAAIAPRVSGSNIVALEAGHHVQLFASTDSPAAFYLLQNGVWRDYWLDAAHPVDCYYADYQRRITWMGTLGSGLLRWKNGVLTHIRIKDGLYDNRIYSILDDGRANLWFSSSKGIFRIAEQELNDFADAKLREVTSIPFTTGQLRFECQAGVQPAAARTRDGRLWFSTTSGLVMIDPSDSTGTAMPPPVAITGILIDGQRFDASNTLTLKPSEKNVEIRYAGLSFIAPEMVSFRYILQGYDKRWTDAGTRRAAFFTNLPPGNFAFKVLARSASGAWSTQPATLSFVVEPRLYQHAWFFPALAAFIALGITAAWRMRIRQLKGRFDLILGERTRIARELHDTLLQGLSGITMQLQALWNRMPVSGEKHTLHEIIADAAQCSAEARQSLWGLRSEDRKSDGFSDKLSKLARELVGSAISLRLEARPQALRLPAEVEYQVLRIAREAISNVVRHARANILTVSATATRDRLRLIVEDDGIGFSRPAVEDGLGHFGLLGMEERAQEIGARLEVGSSPGTGTRVSLSVPLRSSGEPAGNPGTVLTHHKS